MKNIYLPLIAFLFIANAYSSELHISGHVFEHPNSNPVPGHMVSIEIPPSNIYDGYLNEVFTNDDGFYVDEIALPENLTQGEVHISSIDCNGEIMSEMLFFYPENYYLQHNFIICDEPFNDCQADFEWQMLEGNNVQFFNTSIPENTFTNWSFGDGTGSEEPNPVHQFAEQGVYEVCLLIYNDELNCEDQICKEVFVGNNGNCEAFYNWMPAPNNPMAIIFNNESFGNGEISYLWDFGDGHFSEQANPDHLYSEPGIYEVCLQIFAGDCQDTYCSPVDVGNGQGDCQAFFEWVPAPNGQQVIHFINLSVGGDNMQFLWDFGDGQFSDEMNPDHAYPEQGVYVACLQIISGDCQDTYCTEVEVGGGQWECHADFEFQIFDDLSVQFFNLSFPPESNFMWDFGDGEMSEEFEPLHVYNAPGAYEVCLTVINDQVNCEDVICKEVVFGGSGGDCDAYYTWWPGDQPLTIHFMDFSWFEPGEYHWEFGDGAIGSGPVTQHTYQEPGVYEVCLVIFNEECEDVYCESVIVEGGGGGPCEADFEWQPLEGNQIHFINTSWPQQAEFFWEFGDGNAYFEHSPTHLYAEPGVYDVCLNMITADGCQDMVCKEVFVGGNGMGLNASFEMQPETNNPFMIHFFDTSTGNPLEWLWEFGDGTTSSEQNPEHFYDLGGTYEICLTIFDNIHEPDTYCSEIEISEAYNTGTGEYKPTGFITYPNPASKQISINLNLAESQNIKVDFYNTLMQKVKIVEHGWLPAGDQTLKVRVSDLPEGIYLMSLNINKQSFTRKIIISR